MLQIKPVSSQFSVSPQIVVDDLSVIAKLGYKSVINNRPDGEEYDQATNDKLKEKCFELGIEYKYLPVISGEITAQNFQDMNKNISVMTKPILAFCRSGTRSCLLWLGSDQDSTTLAARNKKAGDQGYVFDINQLSLFFNR